MIDFQNASFMKLKPVDDKAFSGIISPMFVQGEHIIQTFQGIRDGVVFTNKRIFAINVRASLARKKIFPPCPTARSNLFPWKPLGPST